MVSWLDAKNESLKIFEMAKKSLHRGKIGYIPTEAITHCLFQEKSSYQLINSCNCLSQTSNTLCCLSRIYRLRPFLEQALLEEATDEKDCMNASLHLQALGSSYCTEEGLSTCLCMRQGLSSEEGFASYSIVGLVLQICLENFRLEGCICLENLRNLRLGNLA